MSTSELNGSAAVLYTIDNQIVVTSCSFQPAKEVESVHPIHCVLPAGAVSIEEENPAVISDPFFWATLVLLIASMCLYLKLNEMTHLVLNYPLRCKCKKVDLEKKG